MAALFIGLGATGFGAEAFAWLVAIGPAAMAAFAGAGFLARSAGAGQIVLDRDDGTIRFKGASGMSTRAVTCGMKGVASVGLLMRRTSAWPSYSVLLRVRSEGEGPLRECRVGSTLQGEEYEPIVAWLAERLRVPREDAEAGG
jgi:hypothetical protein